MSAKRTDPPFLGSSMRRSPYTIEGQLEQYEQLPTARGWRRTVIKGFVFAVPLVFVLAVLGKLFG